MLLLPSVFGCDNGGYVLVASFEDQPVAEQARSVELFLLPSCEQPAVAQGGEPSGALVRVYVDRDGESGGFSPLPAGEYALYGRARDASCAVIASGCVPVVAQSGGAGRLSVVLRAVTGPSCGPRRVCDDGRCVTEGSVADASLADASLDAGTDGGVPDACVLSSEYAEGILGEGPSQYYRLGEASGPTAIDQLGQANGAYQGEITLGAAGPFAGDSDTAVGLLSGRIELPPQAHAALQAHRLSVELWLRARSFPMAGQRFSILVADLPELAGFRLGLRSNGRLILWTTDSHPDGGGELSTMNSLDTAWHHVVLTIDLFTATFYLDGVRAGSGIVPRDGGGSADFLVALGAARELSTDIEVDELAIYPSVLSAEQALAHYQLGQTAVSECAP